MTGCVTLTQGTRSVNLWLNERIGAITKKWIMTPIANTANNRAETITDAAITATDTAISVDSIDGFNARDVIMISGNNASTFSQETQTISSSSGTTINIENGAINDYETGATIIKMTRFITLDLSNLRWTVSLNGYISEATLQNLNTVAADLEAMAYSGGTVKAVFSQDSSRDIQDAAITSCVIIETAKDENPNFQVKLKLDVTGKETST